MARGAPSPRATTDPTDMGGIAAPLTCDDAFIDTNMKPNSSILIVAARQTELAQKALAIEKKHLNYPRRRDVKILIQIVAQLSFRLPRYSIVSQVPP